MNDNSKLKIIDIAAFFLPLGLTTLLITLTHTLFNSGLARLSKPEVYISAFAVAKSLHNILQSPLLMTRQTATALIDSRENYDKVKKFMIFTGGVIVAIYATVSYTSISEFVFTNIMGIKEKETIESAIGILRALLIFPIAISIREFYQAIAIKNRLTPLVTIATSMRLTFVFIFVLLIGRLTFIPEKIMGGVMFAGAGVVEAIVIVLGVKLAFGSNIREKTGGLTDNIKRKIKKITNKTIFKFYIPLVITNYVRSFVMPVINIGLARAENAEFEISSYAVAWGIAVIIFGPLLMYHQVTLNYNKKSEGSIVKKFTIMVGFVITTIFILVAFTDLGYFILTKLVGTSPQMANNSTDVLKIFSLFPIFMIIKEYFWGKLMHKRLTKYVGKAKGINLVSVSFIIFIAAYLDVENMAVIGAVSMNAGALLEAIYLYIVFLKERKINKIKI